VFLLFFSSSLLPFLVLSSLPLVALTPFVLDCLDLIIGDSDVEFSQKSAHDEAVLGCIPFDHDGRVGSCVCVCVFCFVLACLCVSES
jgi:hypothetical protein